MLAKANTIIQIFNHPVKDGIMKLRVKAPIAKSFYQISHDFKYICRNHSGFCQNGCFEVIDSLTACPGFLNYETGS